MDTQAAPTPSAPAELRGALAEGAVAAPLAVHPLRLTGADRLDFLHGQISNDVRGLPVGGATRALLLNHKGHALAEMGVARRERDLFLAVDGDGGGVVRRELEAHVIFDQVEVEDLAGTLAAVTLQGAGAEAVLARALELEPPEAGAFREAAFREATVLALRRDRSGAGGFDLHVLASDREALLAALEEAGARPAEAAALEPFRIAAGIPTAAGEAAGGTLPQEAGLEPLVSYRKGCYLGQEIMARIEARGSLRRELAGVALEALPPAGEFELRRGERRVGRLASVALHPDLGPIGLAVLRREVEVGEELLVGEVAARRVALPMG